MSTENKFTKERTKKGSYNIYSSLVAPRPFEQAITYVNNEKTQ